MLKEAAHKRDLAKQIRDSARPHPEDALRNRVVREAEKLEREASVLEILARTGSHRSKS
jgi:hypothetical protein